MFRIGLFLLTNVAIIAVASITLSLLGVSGILANNGVDLDLGSLLIFCAVFGFAGSFISLLLSKFMAKMSSGTKIISQPQNDDERWLLTTVAELAKKADIGMPEVGIFPAQQSNAFATGWNRNNALVGVSAGLLQRFSRDEVRAVLAHEIGHVANGDMITLSLVQGVVNTFVMFFCPLDWLLCRPRNLEKRTRLRPWLLDYHYRRRNFSGHSRIHHRYVVFAQTRVPRGCCRRRARRAFSDDWRVAQTSGRDQGARIKPDARHINGVRHLVRLEAAHLEVIYDSPTA